MSAPPPGSSTAWAMALRKYSDPSGCVWNVWNVQPSTLGHAVQPTLRDGWLCFQRPEGGERFRLPMSDVPPAWEQLPPQRLDLLRRVAVLSPQTGPMRRISPEHETEDAARNRVSGERRVVGTDDEEVG